MDKIFRNIWIKTNSNTDLSPEFVHTKFLCLLWTRMTWFTRPCHLLDKLKKKHIISIKLITCKLTGCYIDSYRQFFVVDHQQINHHLDQKKKTIKTKILFKISSFRAILLKISRQKFAPVIKSSGFQGNNMRASLPGKLWIFRLYFVVEKTVTAMSL